jgi:hypothetical protein
LLIFALMTVDIRPDMPAIVPPGGWWVLFFLSGAGCPPARELSPPARAPVAFSRATAR